METTQLKVDLEYSTWKAEVEAARSLAVSESYDAYIKGKEDGKKEVVAIKSARDTGTLQLRDKFSCPSFTRDVSGAIPTAEGSHDENHTILSREDEEFLIHLAAEADDAIRLSNAKTEILTKERE